MQAHGTTPASPLLQVRDLEVRFGTKSVVRGVGFEIARGEKLALVGESGSGKTITALSLLRLLGDAAVEGQALFAGRDLLQLSEREMRGVRGGDIAMVFQEPMTALNPLMTIGQQIAEILMLKKGLTGAECAQAAIELLAKTGIPEPARRAGSFPHQLSGGQRQRAMIAMALASEPQLLLADEPTTALDVTLRGQILDLLSDLQRQTGMAVLLITHDLNLVRRFADRVAVMEQGVLVEQGAVAEVFANPQHPYTRRLITSQPRRDVVEATPPAGTQPVVQAHQLRVTYPTPLPGVRGWFKKGEFVAVQGADLQLLPGQTLGVVGESGSGKSTLAQAILACCRRRVICRSTARRGSSQPPATHPPTRHCASGCRWCSRTRSRRSRRASRSKKSWARGCWCMNPASTLPSVAAAWKQPWPRWA